MAVLRTRCISTKVTADEYATLEAVADGQRLSAWARDALLKAARRQPAEHVQLAEVLALRMILLNLHVALANGQRPTTDDVHALIDQADEDKFRRATEYLWSASQRTDS